MPLSRQGHFVARSFRFYRGLFPVGLTVCYLKSTPEPSYARRHSQHLYIGAISLNFLKIQVSPIAHKLAASNDITNFI